MATVQTGKTTKAAPAATTAVVGTADVATVNVTDKKKRTRAKKGEGPFVIEFVDKENKLFPRVPDNVSSVKVSDKAGKSETFSVDSLPPDVVRKLAAERLKSRIDLNLRPAGKDVSDVIGASRKLYDEIKAGKLYTREGSGGPGRSFDFDLWVDVAARTAKIRVDKKMPNAALMTDKQKSALRAKIEGWSPAERKAKTTDWNKDPVVKLAIYQIKMEREATKVDSSESTVVAEF